MTAVAADGVCVPTGTQSTRLDLRTGSVVVYGGHGLGRVVVAAHAEPAAGLLRGIVVEFANGLVVTLPIERAVACLRSVASEVELAEVRDVLRSGSGAIEKSWQARTKSLRAKLASGAAFGLAEIVRDSALRQRGLAEGKTLSSHERELYLRARWLLTTELAAATGTDETAADAWIETQLDWDEPR